MCILWDTGVKVAVCGVLLGSPRIPMTRAPRLGADGAVAAHDLAGAAAAETFVVLAAIELGNMYALCVGEAGLGYGRVVPGGGEQGAGTRIGGGRKGEEGGGESQKGEQGAAAP